MQDWANPLVQETMMLYPEITSTVAESWQAGKWVDEVAFDELTPMWADWKWSPDRHFYVNEVARIRNGEYLVPKRWIIYNGEEYTDAHQVSINNQVCPKVDCNHAHNPDLPIEDKDIHIERGDSHPSASKGVRPKLH